MRLSEEIGGSWGDFGGRDWLGFGLLLLLARRGEMGEIVGLISLAAIGPLGGNGCRLDSFHCEALTNGWLWNNF